MSKGWIAGILDLPTPLGVGKFTQDRQIFLADGEPWRYRGVSAFPLCDRFSRGDDITPFLSAFEGFNTLRVWDYVTWEGTGWGSRSIAEWQAFLAYVHAKGWSVELTLLTDDDPSRLTPAKHLIEGLAGTPGLLIETGNEPTTHKDINTAALRAALEASGLPHASGDGDARFYGTYGTTHTPRDYEWPRKAHDLLEYYHGGGPAAPTDPAYPVPWVGDEPIRPDQATPIPGQPRDAYGVPITDALAHYGALSLLGGGGTVHCECGKYGTLPAPYEIGWIAAALQGLTAFPPAAPNGGYRRIDENGVTSRTYVVGDGMVRIRPTSPLSPEPGWQSLDPHGILWRKS